MNAPWARFALATVAGLVIAVDEARSQVDFRNLDTERPTRVTDAYPVERYAFEVSFPYGLALGEGPARHVLGPHLEYGIGRNVMVGIGADLRVGGPRSERSHYGASVFWNLRRETEALPAMSLAVDATFVGFEQAAVEATGLVTRSIGRSRLHGNAGLRFVDTGDSTTPLAPLWWAGVAWDHTVLRSSTLLVAELVVERPGSGLDTEWAVGAGLRRQVTPTLVAHGGLTQSLRGAGTELTFGLSHAFAIAGLMRRGGAR
ncbi:MAG: hypothetical protein ACKVZ0_15785 [Gemmatimonadales bacterium]